MAQLLTECDLNEIIFNESHLDYQKTTRLCLLWIFPHHVDGRIVCINDEGRSNHLCFVYDAWRAVKSSRTAVGGPPALKICVSIANKMIPNCNQSHAWQLCTDPSFLFSLLSFFYFVSFFTPNLKTVTDMTGLEN